MQSRISRMEWVSRIQWLEFSRYVQRLSSVLWCRHFHLVQSSFKLLLYSLLTPQNLIPSILPRNCLSMCCLLQTNPYKSLFHMFLLRSTCCFLSIAQPRNLLLKCFLFLFFFSHSYYCWLSLTQWFSTFLTVWLFNKVSHVVVTQNHKTIFIATS